MSEQYLTWHEKLMQHHVEENRRLHKLQTEANAKAKQAAAIQQIKRSKPLEQQITELMATLPPALRDRPWTMGELIPRLIGRYNDKPHAQHVGDALRRLGWKRERRWSDGFDGERVWLPSHDIFTKETTR